MHACTMPLTFDYGSTFWTIEARSSPFFFWDQCVSPSNSRQSHSHAFSSPSPFSLLLAEGALVRDPWLCLPRLPLLREAKRAMGRAMGTWITPTWFPGSFISPPQGSDGRKTLVQAGHVSWWQIYLHGGVPFYQSIVATAVCYLLNRPSG